LSPFPAKLNASALENGCGLTRKMHRVSPKDVQNLGKVRNILHMSQDAPTLTHLFSYACIWAANCILDERLVNVFEGENLGTRDGSPH
jgi:hypothetical protein